MMKKALAAAVTALVLSASGAFAVPPNPFIPNDQSSIEEHEPGSLAEAEMAAVKGKGLRSGACTLAVKGTGYIVFGVATALRDPFGQGIGLGLVGAAGAICT